MIHAIWVGPKPLSGLQQRCINSWGQHGESFRLWREPDLTAEFPDSIVPPSYPRTGMVGDWYRYQILERFGGAYFDVDVELLRPIPQWVWGIGDVVGWEFQARGRIGSAVLFAKQGAGWMRYVVERLRVSVARELTVERPRWMLAAGPPALSRWLHELPWEQRPVVLPSDHFYPLLPGMTGTLPPQAFAHHHWTKSWS